jgi:hypothetical protein
MSLLGTEPCTWHGMLILPLQPPQCWDYRCVPLCQDLAEPLILFSGGELFQDLGITGRSRAQDGKPFLRMCVYVKRQVGHGMLGDRPCPPTQQATPHCLHTPHPSVLPLAQSTVLGSGPPCSPGRLALLVLSPPCHAWGDTMRNRLGLDSPGKVQQLCQSFQPPACHHRPVASSGKKGAQGPHRQPFRVVSRNCRSRSIIPLLNTSLITAHFCKEGWDDIFMLVAMSPTMAQGFCNWEEGEERDGQLSLPSLLSQGPYSRSGLRRVIPSHTGHTCSCNLLHLLSCCPAPSTGHRA